MLVVDDNADMREYVTQLLAPYYDVLTASEGIAGLDRVRRERPDLVLSERDDAASGRLRIGARPAHRPGKRRRYRSSFFPPEPARSPRSRVSMRGADDSLVKPFAARELLARVRADLELDREQDASGARHHQLLLDQAQRLAKVGSWEIDVNTSSVTGSTELLRQLQAEPESFRAGFRIHDRAATDRQLVRTAVEAAIQGQRWSSRLACKPLTVSHAHSAHR